MQGIIPFLLIIVSLCAIIFIVVRKFPQLALLDVQNIPEVKESGKKDAYLRRRADKKRAGTGKKMAERLLPIVRIFKRLQLSFRQYVGEVQRKAISHERKLSVREPLEKRQEKRERLQTLVRQAEAAMTSGDYDTAEEHFLAAIKLDAKNKHAYVGLGDVYYAQEQYDEARETYGFVLHLDAMSEHALSRLADIAERQGKTEQAVEYYQQLVLLNDGIAGRFGKLFDLLFELSQYDIALEAARQAVVLEPQNPKYLDNLIEASILVGDKTLAYEAFNELRMVNPENQKLESLKQKIDRLQ